MSPQLDALPGLKARELDGAVCPLCDGPLIRRDYPPLFFRVSMERFGIDAGAVTRQHGLGLMLGSQALARVMGPDQDVAKLIAGPRTAFLCEPCVLQHLAHLFVLLEDAPDKGGKSRGDSSTESAGATISGDAVSNPHPAPPSGGDR